MAKFTVCPCCGCSVQLEPVSFEDATTIWHGACDACRFYASAEESETFERTARMPSEQNQTIKTLAEFFTDKLHKNPNGVSNWFAAREEEWDPNGFHGNLMWAVRQKFGLDIASHLSQNDILILVEFFLDAWISHEEWDVEGCLDTHMPPHAFYKKVVALSRTLHSNDNKIEERGIVAEREWPES
jgi:hypothetical protein